MLFQVFVIVALVLPCALSQNRRICANYNDNDACQQIGRTGQFVCNYNLHSVDCLLNIQRNKTHVGRITGEVAVLGAPLLDENVIVIGEIITRHKPLQTVVIAKTDIPTGFENLRGKRFCNPGFKYNDLIPNLFLEELEDEVNALNTSLCSKPNTTLLERRISSISNFFGSSCRPGLWTQNKEFDSYLKIKYGSLCDLCGANRCDVDYKNPFNDSIKCLIDNNADVAITSLREAQNFFTNPDNRQKYKYLCRSGNSTSPSSLTPCVWSKELPDVIVGEKDAANEVRTYLNTYLGRYIDSGTTNSTDDTHEQALSKILSLNRGETIKFLPTEKSLRDYVQENRTIPSVQGNKLCDTSVNWCTFSDLSYQKCLWLSQAAVSWGITPVVECYRSSGNTELQCLDDIKMKKADIVVASSDYAYASFKKGLTSIAYPETDSRFLSVILTVIKSNDTSIKNFKDLQNKRACLPRYGGKEHLAFIDTLRSLKLSDDTNCDYGTLLSNFVSSSCTPGVRSNLVQESTKDVDKDKLCDLCAPVSVARTATYCNDDKDQKYYQSSGALQCLTDAVADFVVVRQLRDLNGTDANFTVLCKNNTLAAYPGLNVDEDCALNVLTSSQVVAEQSNTKINDITLVLYEFEKWFGQSLTKSFYLFDRFNDTKDLLFRDSTPGLTFSEDLPYIKNSKQLLKNVEVCSSSTTMTTATFSLIILFSIFFINY